MGSLEFELRKERFWITQSIDFSIFMELYIQREVYQKSPTSDGDFPQRGKLFSGTENVLRTSKHNLPCACAHCF
jgi:hypothetical protein